MLSSSTFPVFVVVWNEKLYFLASASIIPQFFQTRDPNSMSGQPPNGINFVTFKAKKLTERALIELKRNELLAYHQI